MNLEQDLERRERRTALADESAGLVQVDARVERDEEGDRARPAGGLELLEAPVVDELLLAGAAIELRGRDAVCEGLRHSSTLVVDGARHIRSRASI